MRVRPAVPQSPAILDARLIDESPTYARRPIRQIWRDPVIDTVARRSTVAIGLMVGAMWIVPFMDVLAKQLGTGGYSVVQLAWVRFTFYVLLLGPAVFWAYGAAALRVREPGLQLLRSALMLVANILYFASLQFMPIPEALALNFVGPIIATALSPVVLGERVGLARWGAVLAGFTGVRVIIRPGFSDFQWTSLLPIGAGGCFALYILASRRLAASAPAAIHLFYSGLFAALALTVALPWFWVTPSAPDLGAMVLIGLVAGVSSGLALKAFELAPVPVLAPYIYSEMVMSCVVGFAFFGDVPDALAWLGIGIVVGGGVYVTIHESVASRANSAQ